MLLLRGAHCPWVRGLAAMAMAAALLSGDVRMPGEFVLQLGVAVMAVVAGFVFCRYFAREN